LDSIIFHPAAFPILITAFVASSVEMVEALTIILAIGVSRGWRTALVAAGSAIVILAAIVMVFGRAILAVPLLALHVIVGSLLLIYGLQWIQKAILRSARLLARHDEEETFRQGKAEAKAHAKGRSRLIDPYGFVIAFKGTLLEGLEVVFIVLTIGTIDHDLHMATLGAALGVVTVGILGLAVHRPLSKIPENAMKFGVGIMLTTFGVYWAGGGAGIRWPGYNWAILGILVFVSVVSLSAAAFLRRRTAKLGKVVS
jgi:uncharacterized membrane protein